MIPIEFSLRRVPSTYSAICGHLITRHQTSVQILHHDVIFTRIIEFIRAIYTLRCYIYTDKQSGNDFKGRNQTD